MRKLTDFFVSKDMFGQPVTVNYRGSDVFRTKIGALLSLVTYLLILFNLVNLVQSFIDGSRQNESQRTEKFDLFRADPYPLKEYDVQLSIINFRGNELYKIGRPRVSIQTSSDVALQ